MTPCQALWNPIVMGSTTGYFVSSALMSLVKERTKPADNELGLDVKLLCEGEKWLGIKHIEKAKSRPVALPNRGRVPGSVGAKVRLLFLSAKSFGEKVLDFSQIANKVCHYFRIAHAGG